ncbi:IS5 family transposase [Arsenicibacter rosenii]|uniref:IS5 family transposase n=1 Tax=Arsenicibacter rosenii TaxID=1750698 RepID=A0A1S2VF93_9BACT|nr:IS5 family transposase [Arsenicibacter rosenii]OIN57393.1 IS5 family transposase [Arsenicibacter rosenii]
MTKQWEPLTDYQWAAISPFLPVNRKRKLDLRQVMNAILWLLRTGSQWRNLPCQFPNWQAVYYYFHRWKTDGTIERINRALNQPDRQAEGRQALPSVCCIDSQSVKLAPMIWAYRGLDAHKKVNGRKRQLLVDTGGRLWAAHVHAANQADGQAALPLVSDLLWYGDRVEKVVGDRAYAGIFAKEPDRWGIGFEGASRPESALGLVPVAQRWVVERSIAWTGFFRRIVKDYEYTVSSSANWLYLANIQIMLQRI